MLSPIAATNNHLENADAATTPEQPTIEDRQAQYDLVLEADLASFARLAKESVSAEIPGQLDLTNLTNDLNEHDSNSEDHR
jgi:hypothetical protein